MEKLKVKLVLIVLAFIYVSRNVGGKTVGKQIKLALHPGTSYSLVRQTNKQWIGPAQKNMQWYKTSATSKSNAVSSKVGEYAKNSNSNHNFEANYDLQSFENLDMMFNSESVRQNFQNQRQQKFPEYRLHSNIPKSKEKSPLESDQLFLYHKDKMSQYSSNFVSTINPEVNTDFHKANLQSTASTTQLPTASQQFEVEHLSGKLMFGSIPSEFIQHSSDSLELNQKSLATEDKSGFLNRFERVDSKLEEKRTQVEEKENSSSNQQANELFNEDNFAIVINTEDKKLFKTGIKQIFEVNFDSFLFNPSAQPLETFQGCKTPRNESGFCIYVQHCMLSSILSSIQHFMENTCIIQGRFIGVCCPEFPVQKVLVEWEDQPENFNDKNNLIEIPQDCGIGTNTRVVGGNVADRKAWPWMVALLNNKKKFFCGGSLINNQYVLTAAHCTIGNSKNQIVARLGEYDFNASSDSIVDYRVAEIKIHGQYNRMSVRNDIALLKLEKPVVFNEFVKTICLPEEANDFIGNVTTLVGWGHLNGDSEGTSDVLQEASFPVISNSHCSTKHEIPIPSSLICAAAVSRDKGACNGDSGGPLMLLDENDRWKVIGIVSWGRRGCNPKFPTVYTRVTHFIDWIRKHSI